MQEDAFKPFDFNTLLKHDIESHAEKVSGIALKASKEAGKCLYILAGDLIQLE